MPYTYADYYNGRTSQPSSQLSNERQMLQQLLGMQGGGSVYTGGMMQRPGDSMLKQAGMTREQYLRMQALQRGRQMSGVMGNVGGGMPGMQRPPGMMHGGMKPPGPMGGMSGGVHPYSQQQQAYGVPQAAPQSSAGYGSMTAAPMGNPAYQRVRTSGFPRKPQKPLPYINY